MDFFSTELAGFGWNVVLVLIFIALLLVLVWSAVRSLKRTGGSWYSVIDELIVGVLICVGFGIFAGVSVTDVVGFLTTPIVFLWDLLINFLRQVGMPI